MYNYQEEIKAAIKDYIEDNIDLDQYRGNRSGLEEELTDKLWVSDSVTGNASGSYTFNRELAKEYVLGNMDLLAESEREFCTEPEIVGQKFLDEEWEYFDVVIRCYLVGSMLSEVLDEIEADGKLGAEIIEGVFEARKVAKAN